MLIDDFETPLQPKSQQSFEPKFWFVYSDGTHGTVQRETTFTELGHLALHVTADGFSQWGSGLVLPLGLRTTARRACDVDASRFAGIRLRARGRGSLRVSLATPALVSTADGGDCTLGRDCYDLPSTAVRLRDDWQTFEIRFCQLFPEGWGQKFTTIDSQRLYALHFRLPEKQAHDVWIDDINFLPHDEAVDAKRCGPACPRDAPPEGADIEPSQIAPSLTDAGLQLHTFQQPTKTCGPLTRRYISYVPKRLTKNSQAPVLITLHGAGASAEAFRNYQTRGRFETLSERDGFILVYANAAPGPTTLRMLPNSGTWYMEPTPVDEVDDFAYLRAIRDDLRARQIIDGKNKFFLVGHSIGAGMAIEAIRRNPDSYSGFAAVMPYLGTAPERPDASIAKHLARVFFAYSLADPGLPNGYAAKLRAATSEWATALGVTLDAFTNVVRTQLPDTVDEGADFSGEFPNATATRHSRAQRIDVSTRAKPDVALRVIEFDHAGHFWPNPTQDNMQIFVEPWGLRNQDIDAADAIWDFFHEACR